MGNGHGTSNNGKIQQAIIAVKKILDDTGPDGKKHMWWPLYITILVCFLCSTYIGMKLSFYAGEHPNAPFIEVFWNFFNGGTKVFPPFGRKAKWLYLELSYLGGFFICLTTWADISRNRQAMPGKEKGSQTWNDWKMYNLKYTYPKDKPEVCDPPEDSTDIGNMIIAEKTFLNMDTRVTRKTNNILIVGTTGSGKTRYWLKPNLLQFNTSLVVTDPSGELLADAGQALMNHGYRVKVFNLSEMQYSCMYNPFRYIRNDEGVMVLVKCLMKNTDDSQASKGDQFFAKAEECLFMAIFYYIYYEYKDHPEQQTMDEVMNMLRKAKVNEKNEDIKSPLDIMFDTLEKKDKNHIAVKNYKIFRMGTGKTLKSILISAGVRMAPFNIKAIRDLTQKDTLHLEELGDRKQALFVITKAEDKTFNFLAAMMYTQLFETMYYVAGTANKNSLQLRHGNCVALKSEQFRNAEQKKLRQQELEGERERYKRAITERDDINDEKFKKENENGVIPWPMIRLIDADSGELLQNFYSEAEYRMFMDCIEKGEIKQGTIRLPNHLRCLLDEFANIGEIPEFLSKLSTIRKYEISCAIILQSLGQIKTMYEKDYSTLIGNCTTQLFLGSTDKEDTEYYSEMLGDKTITVRNTSTDAKHGGLSSSTSQNKDSARLMRPEEIRSMDSLECLVIINGEKPFKDHKYPLETHKNYHELADEHPENLLDYRRMFMVPDCDIESENRKNRQINTHAKQRSVPTNEDKKRMSVERSKEREKQLASADERIRKNAEFNDKIEHKGLELNIAAGEILDQKGLKEDAEKAKNDEKITIDAALAILEEDTRTEVEKKIKEGTIGFNKDGNVIGLMNDDPFAAMLAGE